MRHLMETERCRLRSYVGRLASLVVLAVLAAPLRPPGGAVAAQPSATAPSSTVEPLFCDTTGVQLHHRFRSIGFVFLGTGNYELDFQDFAEPGTISRLYERSYHSVDTRSTHLGPGWSDNFSVRLRSGTGPGPDAFFTDPDGWASRFEDGFTTAGLLHAKNTSATLMHTDTGWVATHRGYVWTLDQSGSLVRTEHDGQRVDVRYEAGRLSESEGPNGAELRFSIRNDGPGDRLMSVTDARDPRQSVAFTYDDIGRLIKTDRGRNDVWRFSYEGNTQRIATIADEGGITLIAATYDSRGRVARLQDAAGLLDGEAELYTYEELPGGDLRTTVTYPTSEIEPGWHPVQITTHNADGDLIREELRPTSTQTFVSRFTFDRSLRYSTDPPCPPLEVAGVPVMPPTPLSPSPPSTPSTDPLSVFASVITQLFLAIAALLQGLFSVGTRGQMT